MPNAFGRRILHQRTRALAARGVAPDVALLPPHLVCVAGDHLVALLMPLVASVRPFGCQPVPLLRPRAAPVVLGLALFGHRLVSVLDLHRLMWPGQAADVPAAEGSMILLRTVEPPVALRVQQVLGVMPLQASVEPGRALMPANAALVDPPELVTLLAADVLAASISALDHA